MNDELNDFEMDQVLSCDAVAEKIGARGSLVLRLVREGLIDAVEQQIDEPLLPESVVLRLRRMQRLRRDLGVNFTGAAIILDLVKRLEQMKREMEALQR